TEHVQLAVGVVAQHRKEYRRVSVPLRGNERRVERFELRAGAFRIALRFEGVSLDSRGVILAAKDQSVNAVEAADSFGLFGDSVAKHGMQQAGATHHRVLLVRR